MSVYFGSVNHIQKRLTRFIERENIKHILIVASGINFIDLAGGDVLIAENQRLVKQGGGLYFVGLKSSVYEFAAKSGFIKKIGNDHFYDTKSHAIRDIYKNHLNRDICDQCTVKLFTECQQQ